MAAGKRKATRGTGASKRRTPAEAPREAASSPQPRASWRRALLLAVAAAYLTTVWLDGVGSNLPARTTPRPWVYFGQIAALFKWAGQKQIDYRAEGFVCSEKRWVEIDVRPYFPIDAGNKENRFYRAVQFHRRDRKVMRALEAYVMQRVNERAEQKIAGVRFLSLRIPYPEPGTTIEPYERRPLAAYPQDQRHDWYYTPKSKLRERCNERAPAQPAATEEDADHSTAKPPEDEP